MDTIIDPLFNWGTPISFSFSNIGSPGGYSAAGIRVDILGTNGSNAEIQSVLIHEATHAYTSIMGYDSLVFIAAGGHVGNIEAAVSVRRGYQEAAAITVEERFRSEMGYASRSTVTSDMIGINDYGFWPWMANNSQSNLYGQVGWVTNEYGMVNYGVSLMQTHFIWYDIIRNRR